MNFTDKQIEKIIKDVSDTDCGFVFIKILLYELGAFSKGISFDNVNMAFYNQGRRDKGIWLLDKLRKCNFDKFVLVQKERD